MWELNDPPDNSGWEGNSAENLIEEILVMQLLRIITGDALNGLKLKSQSPLNHWGDRGNVTSHYGALACD